MVDDAASQSIESLSISTVTSASPASHIEPTSPPEFDPTPVFTSTDATDSGSFLSIQNATSITDAPDCGEHVSTAKANITGPDYSMTDTSLTTSTSEVFMSNVLAPTGTSHESSAGRSTPQSVTQPMAGTLTPSAGSQTTGAVNRMSSVVSIYQTTLSNGVVVATSTYLGREPSPTTESNNGSGQYNSPGPIEITPEPSTGSTGFFKRPVAATGVIIVVLLVIGCLLWMGVIIQRHRRQAANAKRRPISYAYNSAGLTPANRGDYFSYDAPHWPQQSLQSDDENTPPLQLRTSYPAGTPEASFVPPAISPSNDKLPPNILVTRRSALREPGPSSPPIPPRSPLRPSSPPSKARASVIIASEDLENGTRAQSFASFSEFYSPPSTSQLPLSQSHSFGRQLQLPEPSSFEPYSYPTRLATIFNAIEPSSLYARDSSVGSTEYPYRSSVYVVPSPTLSTDERLGNPFSDAESPPQQSVTLPYVHEAAVLARGVSLRRNNKSRDKPEQQLTPNPSAVEYRSHMVEGGSSAFYPLLTRQTLGHGRKSGSLSTAETSIANASKEMISPVEAELFYNPAFASPVRTFNPDGLGSRDLP